VKKYLIILILIVTAGCGGNSTDKKVLPVQDMKLIMWDMLKADEYYIKLTTNDTAQQFKNENFRLYDQVFRAYKINRKQFYSSYKYYESHPDLFKVLIDSVDEVAKRQRTALTDTTGKPK
jgi:hypothetical protein